ncbi:hypothetical protein P154DRAFT_516518 [Amniculicola lignicola CBS 123094]|uniref:Extracellular membrane protein CFEM domain-containing protein n=1 Tax=Amniculicola lignicola CBS 123094 TaxID=1392246 RepID=A0A6A5X474_9PLEO|nr:hypothetical protein P154DRAFT_516518 [Amniculicola lignicola CBS 123094]
MLSYSTVGALLAFSGAVAAIPYDGPIATPVAKRWSHNGFTPKPTSDPKPLLELFRRQEDPAFCGYLTGDPDAAVTCRVGSSCMYDEMFSWFGCCTGTAQTDCNIITACVESTKLDECLEESSCFNDPLAMACTDREEPFCMGLYTVISSSTFGHFECAATDATYQVLGSTTGGSPSFTPSFTLDPTDTATLEDEPTSTIGRFRSSAADTATVEEAESSTTEESESSTTEEPSFTRARSSETSTTESSTPTEAAASSSLSSAGAVRTAQAVLGAAGGVAGLIAMLA